MKHPKITQIIDIRLTVEANTAEPGNIQRAFEAWLQARQQDQKALLLTEFKEAIRCVDFATFVNEDDPAKSAFDK